VELIPSIDLLDGRVVRLLKGNYAEATVYETDALALAQRYASDGAKRLHVVDLNGARDGTGVNQATIQRVIVDLPDLAVQVGGGIRSTDAIAKWLDLGAARVVVGTLALEDPETVKQFTWARPGALIVALDAWKNGKVAFRGWRETPGPDVQSLAKQVSDWAIAAILFTAIDRDGTREGPDAKATVALQSLTPCMVIASGGIGTLEHIESLARAGVRAAVCGRALMDETFTFAQAQTHARLEQA